MILLCSGCNTRKEYHFIELNEKFHPYHVGICPECGEEVFEVDELIADTIIELNDKGWATEFCCSGHLEENYIATYIKFKHMPETMPRGFYKDDDCIRVMGRSRNLTGIDGFDELVKINRILYEWALKLPLRKGAFING
jgi:hypothetical protein